MEIRQVTPNDSFLELSALFACSWKAAYKGIVPQHFLDTLGEDGWVPFLQNNHQAAYIALEGGTYLAAASALLVPQWEGAVLGEILQLYVHPAYMGKGIGAMLLQHCIAVLRGQGAQTIYLWVLTQNQRARRFYEKHGMKSGVEKKEEVGGVPLSFTKYVLEA